MEDEPLLMGAAEAAERLGVRQPNLRAVAGLPEPYQQVRASTLWRATDIEQLAQQRADRRRAVSE